MTWLAQCKFPTCLSGLKEQRNAARSTQPGNPLEQLTRRGPLPAALDALLFLFPSPVFFHLYAPLPSNTMPGTLQ